MTYLEKLQDPLWKAKRHWIIRQDGFHCRNCSAPGVSQILKAKTILREGKKISFPEGTYIILESKLKLNVHHKCYINGKEPWEYEDDALITLCPECHKKEYETNTIPIYSDIGDLIDYCHV